MNKINNNNLDALKAFYGVKSKKADKEQKQEEVKEVKEFEPKKVQASALDVLASQIKGAQLSRIDKSEEATTKRLEQAFANSTFMKSLNELQGFEEDDFVAFAMANVTGVDKAKLAKHLERPLSIETQKGLINFDKLIA